MSTVLVCDDELMNRKVASKILAKEGFDVIEATDGKEALELLKEHRVDVILMDLMMPVMDGYEATSIIKADKELASIPLIIISALSDKEAITKGLSLGADEYLTKPFDLVEFKLRVTNAVKIGSYQHMLKDNQAYLEKLVEERTKELANALLEVQKSEKDIISILGKTAEFRDNETSLHTLRVGLMSEYLAKELGWSAEDAALLRLAAPMHDMGKVGIRDNVLLKPAKLSDEEFEHMKEHAEIGYKILSQKKTPLLELAAEIAYTHHEKYDGSGYPRGLQKDAIPQSGAIVALTDVFDALRSKRPYKEPFSLEKSLSIIKEGAGTHFDPQVVDIFVNNIDAIQELRKEFEDV